MPEVVYFLCAFLSVGCTVILLKGFKNSRSNFLFWSGICFGLLAANNILLFADLVIFPELDFGGALIRQILGASAGGLLLFGLIWEIS